MNIRKALAAILVAATISTPAYATTWAMAFADADANANAKDDKASRKAQADAELYESASDAIDEEDWEEAVRRFSKVVERKSSRTDGALYWMAYALNRLGRRSEAIQSLDALKRAYPASKWLDDAKALELELRQARGERVAPEGMKDDELKIIAINSLMHSDPEKAFPLLEKIVRSGTATKKMKEQALFILTQSPSPRAQQLIGSLARGNANPQLQEDAVKYLGIHGGERNLQLLSDVYASATSVSVKKAVLQSFMIAGQRTRVLAAAKGEKNPELREDAIQLLGVMGARADLASMYETETSASAKKRIIQALFISGDVDRLTNLAKSEKDVSLRTDAIRNLGLLGRKTAPMLLSLYASESSHEVKKAVIEGLFVQGNARTLIDLSKKEGNRELKREIIQKLSIMGDEEAVAYMLQILDE